MSACRFRFIYFFRFWGGGGLASTHRVPARLKARRHDTHPPLANNNTSRWEPQLERSRARTRAPGPTHRDYGPSETNQLLVTRSFNF